MPNFSEVCSGVTAENEGTGTRRSSDRGSLTFRWAPGPSARDGHMLLCSPRSHGACLTLLRLANITVTAAPLYEGDLHERGALSRGPGLKEPAEESGCISPQPGIVNVKGTARSLFNSRLTVHNQDHLDASPAWSVIIWNDFTLLESTLAIERSRGLPGLIHPQVNLLTPLLP